MQFKQLILENFQAHKLTTVNFTAGLNIIVGESDMGKSSILRALRKLVRDVPAGNSFINKDATSMKLQLIVVDDDGHEYTIIRQVTPSKNLYYLDKQEFGGFGREIPEEVQRLLEMFLIELENSEKVDLHFFDQHDTPFMVSKGSAGTRSKLLGRIAGLHTLDKGIVTVNKDIRAGNSVLKTKAIDRDIIQEKVDNAPNTANSHKVYNACHDRIQLISADLVTLDKLISIQKIFLDVVEKGKKEKAILSNFPKIDVNFLTLREDIQRLNKLKELNNAILSIDNQISSLPPVYPDMDIDFDSVRKNMQLLASLQEYHIALQDINSNIYALDSLDFDTDIVEAQNAWASLLTELKICPTCKQTTTHVGEHCKEL